jgi:hypothetical protein
MVIGESAAGCDGVCTVKAGRETRNMRLVYARFDGIPESCKGKGVTGCIGILEVSLE